MLWPMLQSAFCKTMKWYHFVFIHRAFDCNEMSKWCAGHTYTNDNRAAQRVQTSPNLKVPFESPHPNSCDQNIPLCYYFFSKLFFFFLAPALFKWYRGYYSYISVLESVDSIIRVYNSAFCHRHHLLLLVQKMNSLKFLQKPETKGLSLLT